jgi:hypothetical protein
VQGEAQTKSLMVAGLTGLVGMLIGYGFLFANQMVQV